MGIFLEPRDESACALQGPVEIIDAEEQEQPIAGCPFDGTRQRRVVMGAPLVEAEQHRSVRVEELTKVGMRGALRTLAEQRPVPPEAPGHVPHADDRPRAFHGARSSDTEFGGGRKRVR